MDEDEAARRELRAARFGSLAPSARGAAFGGAEVDPKDFEAMAAAAAAAREAEVARFAGDEPSLKPLGEAIADARRSKAEEAEAEATRRKRAERFGRVLPEDLESATAAAEALLRLPGEAAGSRQLDVIRAKWTEGEVNEGKAMLGGGDPRPEAVHVCANGYIQAGDRDVLRLFRGYDARFVGERRAVLLKMLSCKVVVWVLLVALRRALLIDTHVQGVCFAVDAALGAARCLELFF